MILTKENLDKRICDVEQGTGNTQTYREFIRQSEEEFGLDPEDLDSKTDEELNMILDFMDYLWTK